MAEAGARPSCSCHDEPMYWNRDTRYDKGGFFYCAEVQRQRCRDRYERMEGPAYSRMLLQHRRVKALRRLKARTA